MTFPEPIRVEGLASFSKALRRLDNEAPKQLRLAFNDTADLIVQKVRPWVPKKTGRAAASIKAKSTRTEARVQGGSKNVPWYPWLDFGGKVGRSRSIERPFVKEGRYIYKGYYEVRDSGQLEHRLAKGLLRVIADAGLEVD